MAFCFMFQSLEFTFQGLEYSSREARLESVIKRLTGRLRKKRALAILWRFVILALSFWKNY